MTPLDPEQILSTLDRHGVRFVLIGGLAANVLGSPSVTNDLDLCYERTPENLTRLAAALIELGARLRGVEDDVPFILDARTLAAGDSFTFNTAAGPLDILGTPAGMAGFDELRSNAEEYELHGHRVLVCSLSDLIRMKSAAARPKDRVELAILYALRDELEGQAESE